MSGSKRRSSRIYVVAGTNGAGKTSVTGAAIVENGGLVFDPDEATRRILAANPGIDRDEANSSAWLEGKRLLERAIAERLDYAFETTLGGTTIAALLERALAEGIRVFVWYVGLASPELHIARVEARVRKGGHPVPEARIRERYDRGRLNLIRLLPRLTELRLVDNSEEADPDLDREPRPRLLLHVRRGHVVSVCAPREAPDWAKPILAAALRLGR